ncbi:MULTISPECIES: hypothetical protein [unclassified Bradyrhizobium]|uniref:hypothetical protein n=1 Tax=unclassified Bradyrhizobium TaxID=2631580 RepID=UPI002478B681|nr:MULTISPECIES: hypothetical protein [unclassified Bradyrhizobium]WGS17596.1 hypothetical protein MTX22_23460 [Bradyrhizobium sp. ISRA463]WGS24379.1 hypothetical protein MTX19_21125 [Bradyrhizobium sp. ISRA464]
MTYIPKRFTIRSLRHFRGEPKRAANLVSKDAAPAAPGPVASPNEADFGSA